MWLEYTCCLVVRLASFGLRVYILCTRSKVGLGEIRLKSQVTKLFWVSKAQIKLASVRFFTWNRTYDMARCLSGAKVIDLSSSKLQWPNKSKAQCFVKLNMTISLNRRFIKISCTNQTLNRVDRPKCTISVCK